MKNKRNYPQPRGPQNRINEFIRASEVRLIDHEGENLGVIATRDALAQAREQELDLIEISPNAQPPVAKIMDYGKFQYDQKKKAKQSKTQRTETKTIQVKPGTGEHDLGLKAKKIGQWLDQGHRVKFDLFLRGRAKYMDKSFLEERMNRLLKLITVEYKIADGPKKSPKGMSIVLERDKK